MCIIIRHIAMATKHIIFGHILENMTQVESLVYELSKNIYLHMCLNYITNSSIIY